MDQREEELSALLAQAEKALSEAGEPAALEQVRVKFLGRQGEVAARFAWLKEPELSAEDRGRLGKR